MNKIQGKKQTKRLIHFLNSKNSDALLQLFIFWLNKIKIAIISKEEEKIESICFFERESS